MILVPQFINQKNEAINTSFSVAVILLRVYAHIIKPVKRKPDGCVPLIQLSTYDSMAIFVVDIAIPADTAKSPVVIPSEPSF